MWATVQNAKAGERAISHDGMTDWPVRCLQFQSLELQKMIIKTTSLRSRKLFPQTVPVAKPPQTAACRVQSEEDAVPLLICIKCRVSFYVLDYSTPPALLSCWVAGSMGDGTVLYRAQMECAFAGIPYHKCHSIGAGFHAGYRPKLNVCTHPSWLGP